MNFEPIMKLLFIGTAIFTGYLVVRRYLKTKAKLDQLESEADDGEGKR